jgi:hypothetical protein
MGIFLKDVTQPTIIRLLNNWKFGLWGFVRQFLATAYVDGGYSVEECVSAINL